MDKLFFFKLYLECGSVRYGPVCRNLHLRLAAAVRYQVSQLPHLHHETVRLRGEVAVLLA